MIEPESPLADSYHPMLGVRKKLYSPRNSYSAVVIHTTGHGPVTRATTRRYAWWRKKHNISDPLEAALWIYKYAHNAGGHYLVGQDGTVYQTCPENLACWQVGGRKAWRFDRPWVTRRYGWWVDRWGDKFASPKDLAGGMLWAPYSDRLSVPPRVRRASRYGSCNANAIGIEVVPPLSNPRGQWSSACWRALCSLVEDICHRREIPLVRERVISHSDAMPLSRTTRKGEPWDPGSLQWSWDQFRDTSANQ